MSDKDLIRFFGRITNTEPELAEIADAFEEDLRLLGLDVSAVKGYYLVIEHPVEVVVTRYEDESELMMNYRALEELWEALGGEEPGDG